MNIFCTNCGHDVDVRASTCGDCGTGLSDEHRRLAALLPPMKQGQNSFAVTSLVLGILGLTVFPLISSVAGVIFGHLARRQLREEPQDGANMAVAGLILGYIGLAGIVGFTILFFWLARFSTGLPF